MPQTEELLNRSSTERASTYEEALLTLRGQLRPAGSGSPFPRIAGFHDDVIMDVNLTLLTLDVWIDLDQELADKLFRGLVDALTDKGALAARIARDTKSVTCYGAYPFLLQRALQLYKHTQDASLLRDVLPDLKRYMQWVRTYYDPHGTGHPQWQHPEEAYVRDTYQQGLSQVDLTTFLLCETIAYARIGEIVDVSSEMDGDLHTYQLSLERALMRDYWSSDRLVFRDLDQDLHPIGRGTISSLTPLLWEGLPTTHRQSLLQESTSGSGYMTEHGLRLWIPWPDDPEPPRVTGLHQLILLPHVGHDLAQRILLSVEAHRQEAGSIPSILYGGHAIPASAEDTFATAAAYVKATHWMRPRQANIEISRSLRWLDEHRLTVLILFIATVALVTLGTAAHLITKETIIHSSIRPVVGLAVQHYDEGRYENAEELYRSLLMQTRNTEDIEFRLANTLFQQGKLEEAAKHYRRVLELGNHAHKAMLNLGLTLYRLGNLDEAKQCYETFLVHHGHKHPELTARAKTAIELIEADGMQ